MTDVPPQGREERGAVARALSPRACNGISREIERFLARLRHKSGLTDLVSRYLGQEVALCIFVSSESFQLQRCLISPRIFWSTRYGIDGRLRPTAVWGRVAHLALMHV